MGKGDRKRRTKKKKKRIKIVKKHQFTKIDIKKLKEYTNMEKHYFEIINEELKYENNPIHFLKWATKSKELEGTKIKDMTDEDFEKTFPFAKNPENENNDKDKYKNLKNTEFPLGWFKEKNKNYHISKEKNEKFSNILKNNELKNFVKDLIPYSFILHAKIKLTSPYFSKDDDDFYLIDNPILKEKAFKVPMVRGSGWKGAIASGFRAIINERADKRELLQSYLRMFGTGSQEFRDLKSMLDDYINKSKEFDFNKLISYFLFELGIRLEKNDIDKLKDTEKRTEWLKNNLWEKFNKGVNGDTPIFLRTHKGRAIFYPTYFDKLSLEVINPHNRKTRAGTMPIYYEVVPKGTEGILQIVYIPFDSVLKNRDEIEKEVKEDIENLIKAIEKTQNLGIGAKSKLGWGQFSLEDKFYCINKEIKNIEVDWKKCEEKSNES